MNDPIDVLLVDDRKEELLTLETLLSTPEYNLIRASSGQDALRHVLDRDFAVILLDVRMPDMDGFEVASLVKQRERSRHIPIIFLTAELLDVGSIYRAYSIGAVDYLVKPIDADILRAKVAIFADLFRKDRRIREQNEAICANERAEKERQLTALANHSQRRYRNLAESIPQIVWTASPAGELDYCSQRWMDLTGLSFAELSGWGWLSVLHPDDRARCEAQWKEAVRKGAAHELECRLRVHEGGHRWHLCRALPERDEEGRIIGWLGTFTDCDDLKRAQAVAEAALEARDEFLSIASHELRTPLTALQLQLQSLLSRLRKSGDGDVRLIGKVEMSVRQSTRLDQLIETLLDVSRLAADRLILDVESFDMAAAVGDVVERMGEEVQRSGATVTFDADGPVPGRWDRLRVEQVAVNLLSNALKHARGNTVSVRVSRRDRSAVLEVADRGPGIPSENLDKIFERFEGSRTRGQGGLGLGLYITRRIVETHGGTVSVSSTVGAGSTFTVTMPVERRDEVQPQRPEGLSATSLRSNRGS